MVHSRWLVLLFLFAASVATAGEIEIVDAPDPEVRVGPTWAASYDAALAAADERPLLLFFTAGWCGYCHEMETKTLSDPEVRRALATFVCVKIDVDAEANRAVCRRYHPEGGIPAYVLVERPGGGGRVLPGGYLKPRTFLEALRNRAALPTRDVSNAVRHHVALARFYLQRGDTDEFESHLAGIDLLLDDDREDSDGADLEALLADAVEILLKRANWSLLIDVADECLGRFPEGERAAAVRRNRAQAIFHRDGVLEDGLKRRIRERLSVFEEPYPEAQAVERVKRWLGTPDADRARAREAWVERQNEALHELAGYGEAAVDLLLAAVRTAPEGAAERAATALGWIRSSRARPILARWASDASLDDSIRTNAVRSLGLMRDAAALPLFRTLLLDVSLNEALRLAAAEAIRRVGMRADGITEATIGNALLVAATNAGMPLRHECLHALLTVEGEYDLKPLIPLLRDHREGWTGERNSQYAAWCLLQATGKTLEQDGEPIDEITPAIAEHLATWLEAK